MPRRKPGSSATRRASETFDRLGALPKKTITVAARLAPRDRDALRGHFQGKGITLGTGITMILNEYLIREGLK